MIKRINWVNYDEVIDILNTSKHKVENFKVNWGSDLEFDLEIENELLDKLIKKMQTLKRFKRGDSI